MLIDYFTERYTFTESDLWISVVAYLLAGLIALLLRRWGQSRVAKKYGLTNPRFPDLWLQDLTSGIWAAFFFTMTGCLKGPLREEDCAKDPKVRRKVFLEGILFPIAGVAIFFLLYTVLEIFAQHSFMKIPLMFTKALVSANISLLIFSLLPLPCSDCEKLLLCREPGEKGIALRKQGTYPFLIFTILGLLLGSITVSMEGTAVPLSGILTLFPFFLIGG